MIRSVKHFVVSWENGKILVSRAREIIPNRTYEIVHMPPPSFECAWNAVQPSFPKPETKGIGLGERTKIKSSLS